MTEPRINVTVRLSTDDLRDIDFLAEQEALPRSMVMRQMLRFTLAMCRFVNGPEYERVPGVKAPCGYAEMTGLINSVGLGHE